MATAKTPTATDRHIDTIRARRMDDAAREMMEHGIRLTWDQDDELGQEAGAWLRERLGLIVETDADGATYEPAPRRPGRPARVRGEGETRTVSVRLTEREREAFGAAAGGEGDVGGWLRDLGRRASGMEAPVLRAWRDPDGTVARVEIDDWQPNGPVARAEYGSGWWLESDGVRLSWPAALVQIEEREIEVES